MLYVKRTYFEKNRYTMVKLIYCCKLNIIAVGPTYYEKKVYYVRKRYILVNPVKACKTDVL